MLNSLSARGRVYNCLRARPGRREEARRSHLPLSLSHSCSTNILLLFASTFFFLQCESEKNVLWTATCYIQHQTSTDHRHHCRHYDCNIKLYESCTSISVYILYCCRNYECHASIVLKEIKYFWGFWIQQSKEIASLARKYIKKDIEFSLYHPVSGCMYV